MIADDEQQITGMINSAAELQGRSVWVARQEEGLFLIRTIREINGLSLNTLGTMIIQLDMEKLIATSTSFNSLFEHSEIILMSGSEILYSPADFGEIPEQIQSSQKNYEIIDHNNEKYFKVNRTISDAPLSVTCLVPYDGVFYPMLQTYTVTFLTITAILILVVLLALFFIRTIVKHYHILIQKMDAFDGKVQTAAVTEYDYTERMDELGLLHRHFDNMAHKINTLISRKKWSWFKAILPFSSFVLVHACIIIRQLMKTCNPFQYQE